MKNSANGVVLIVDDVETNRVILGEIIGAIGCKTVLAENGIDALEQIAKEPPRSCSICRSCSLTETCSRLFASRIPTVASYSFR